MSEPKLQGKSHDIPKKLVWSAWLKVTFPRDRGGISYKPFVRWGRLAGVKMGLGRLVDADYSLGLRARL